MSERHDDLFWREQHEPITESDASLRDIVAQAELPPLLAALAAATGDTAGLTPGLRPPLTPVNTVGHPHGGMTPEQQASARELAYEGLRRLRDEQITTVETLADDTVTEHGLHRLAALLPREFGATHLSLRTQLLAQHVVGQQSVQPVDQAVDVVDQHPGHPVDDGITEPSRGAVPDRRHPVLGGLDHGQPPTFLARRQQADPTLLQQIMFRRVIDMPMESHGVRDAQRCCVVEQRLGPPSAADDVEMQVGEPVA